MLKSNSYSNSIVRPAAVAGMFYPSDENELYSMVEQMLGSAYIHDLNAPKTPDIPVPKALIVPHAGYIYSGQAAADVYARLKNSDHHINQVVLLGPAHRIAFQGIAGSSADYFETPLGRIPLDHEGIQHACQLEGVASYDAAHDEEHSLEVQLPFLQLVLGAFSLAPFVVGQASQSLTASLLEKLWGDDETLIVISSDLSHFEDYKSACEHDAHTSQLIEAFQGEQLDPHDACGYAPIRGLLEVAKQRNMTVERVTLCNSGDTAGDKSRVVGYGSYVLY